VSRRGCLYVLLELTCRMDALITETIKECFKGTTMLVIAHRLATIMH
jgi:ABC-type multidrug transport system fused ATPase/permease subunit